MTTANTFTYSNEIAVPGKTKGGGGGGNGNNLTMTDETATVSGKTITQINSLVKKITVGPNPNNGNFWFTVSGIDKETLATLYTIDGKQLNQFRIKNLQQQQVNGLRSGIYFLKVLGMDAFKITVQGGGNGFPINNVSNSNAIKN
jgi:hypothetical protein